MPLIFEESHRDENPHSVEQTIEYVAEFVFGNKATEYGDLHIERRRYHSLEGMLHDRVVEKRRKKVTDRVTSVRYMNVLTKHGRDVYRSRYGTFHADGTMKSLPLSSELSVKLGITLDEWMRL